MTDEPDSLILRILREMRTTMANMATKDDIAELRAEMRSEIADVRSELRSLRADVASDFLIMRKEFGDQIAAVRKELGEQINGLRRAVFEYHTTVIGHGVMISDLDTRLRRVERHLNLSDPH